MHHPIPLIVAITGLHSLRLCRWQSFSFIRTWVAKSLIGLEQGCHTAQACTCSVACARLKLPLRKPTNHVQDLWQGCRHLISCICASIRQVLIFAILNYSGWRHISIEGPSLAPQSLSRPWDHPVLGRVLRRLNHAQEPHQRHRAHPPFTRSTSSMSSPQASSYWRSCSGASGTSGDASPTWAPDNSFAPVSFHHAPNLSYTCCGVRLTEVAARSLQADFKAINEIDVALVIEIPSCWLKTFPLRPEAWRRHSKWQRHVPNQPSFKEGWPRYLLLIIEKWDSIRRSSRQDGLNTKLSSSRSVGQ